MNKNNLKIDFIIGKMTAGGAQRVVANLANQLVELDHKIRIITFMEGDAYNLDPRVERIRFPKSLLLPWSILSGFIRLYFFYSNKKNRPDVISSHIGSLGFATIPIAKLYRIKIIVSEHFNHYHQKLNFKKKILWNHLFKHADAITILTKYDLQFFNSRNDKVIVMENPCSFEPIQCVPNIREKSIIAVGDLNRYEHKGFDNLLDIASKVLPIHKDWKMKIVGTGDFGADFLQKKAENLGITDQIIFTGYRSDIKDIMSNSEIFILTSRYEGLPMVLLEALSQGMACISYDCISGPSDIIINNVNGILIENQNKAQMIIELEKLISNNNFRNELKENSSKELEKFKINNVCNKWLSLINEILKQ